MGLIVQKFGGTSVATIEKIKKIVPAIRSEIDNHNQVIVVVSAMAGVTNQLVSMCTEVSNLNSWNQLAEYDSVLSIGEVVTSSLLALALQESELEARSVLAWQLPIVTDSSYTKALVKYINTNLLKDCLAQGIVPVIAGFQGITSFNRLSTLGRGGTDTTAALISAAMHADRCDIYTDVDGVYTADPRIIPDAKKLNQISFEEMLELASSGAKVLHPRSVEAAMRYKIPIRVLSSFTPNTNSTLITSSNKIMENKAISGITSNKNLLKITIISHNLSFIEIGCMVVDTNSHIEIMHEVEKNKKYNFITNLTDKNNLQDLFTKLKQANQISDFVFDTKIATISIVGYGIRNDNSWLISTLSKLKAQNIEINMIQISEIKLTLLLKDDDTEKTIYTLHSMLE